MLTYLETYSQGRVSATTISLGSVMSSSDLLSVWHCVSDSFLCCTDEFKQSNMHDFSLTLDTIKNKRCSVYIESFCLPARMLWAGGRTCGRCRWWQRCRRWWCPESLSTTAAAAQGPSFSPVTPLHLSSAEHSLQSHRAGYGNEDCTESSIHYLHREEGDELK